MFAFCSGSYYEMQTSICAFGTKIVCLIYNSELHKGHSSCHTEGN